jgi:hypothetical protein
MRRSLLVVGLTGFLSALGAPAAAGGSWLYPVQDRLDPGDDATFVGYVGPGESGWLAPDSVVCGVDGDATEVLAGEAIANEYGEVMSGSTVPTSTPVSDAERELRQQIQRDIEQEGLRNPGTLDALATSYLQTRALENAVVVRSDDEALLSPWMLATIPMALTAAGALIVAVVRRRTAASE